MTLRLRARGTRAPSGDSGMTLVELLVYVILLSVVIGLVATFFIRSLAVQKTVVTTGQANNSAQVAFSGLERDVRNAAAGGIKADGNLLVLYTGGGLETSSSWRCKAWFYVPPAGTQTSGRLYTTTTDAGQRIAPTSSTFSSGTPAGWTLAVDGVVPTDEATQVFAGNASSGVTVSMVATRSGNPTDFDAVALSTRTLPRPQDMPTTTNGGCF